MKRCVFAAVLALLLLIGLPAFAHAQLDTVEVKHPTNTPITFYATAPADMTSIVEFRLYINGTIRASVPAGQVQPGATFEWPQLPSLAKGSHVVYCESVGVVDGQEIAARGINPTSLMVNVEGPNSPNGLGKKK